jgi:proteasome lid subunit RPN8/RPN11
VDCPYDCLTRLLGYSNMVPVTPVLRLSPEHLQQMLKEVSNQYPEEACGLVAGLGWESKQVYPVENKLHSSVRFLMEPEQQVRFLLEIEANGWELLAIYHSHPNGPDTPSATDIAEIAFPDAITIIWSRAGGEWKYRGFNIQDGNFYDIPIAVD